ncbi:MAG: hypothetical protein AAF657_36655 [Acidobacteriota bacterium]
MHKASPLPLGLFVFLAAGLGSAAATKDWSARLGVVERLGEHFCLATTGTVESGQSIRLVSPSEPQAVTEAVVAEADSTTCRDASESLLPGNFHRLQTEGLEALSWPAIALLDAQASVDVSDGLAQADLEDDGTAERFRACTSREGLHLTIWSGPPLIGQRRWHQYYYLGYDTEPTCDERDFRETAIP